MPAQEPDIEALRKRIPDSIANAKVVSARLARREAQKFGTRIGAWLLEQLKSGDAVNAPLNQAKYPHPNGGAFFFEDSGWWEKAYYPTNATPALGPIALDFTQWNEGELVPAEQAGRDWMIPARDAAEEIILHALKHWLRHVSNWTRRARYRSFVLNERVGFIVGIAVDRAMEKLEKSLKPRQPIHLRAICSRMKKWPHWELERVRYDKYGIFYGFHNKRTARKYHPGRWADTRAEALQKYWARLDRQKKGGRGGAKRSPSGPASLNKWHGEELKWERPTIHHRTPSEWPQR